MRDPEVTRNEGWSRDDSHVLQNLELFSSSFSSKYLSL